MFPLYLTVSDVTECKLCVRRRTKMEYDEAHKPSEVQTKISEKQSELYQSQLS